MITAWRIVKTQHSASAFDGEGARIHGGRWNSLGTPMVYTADYLATAALELLVNIIDYAVIFQHYDSIAAEIPIRLITELDPLKLPADWQDSPPPKDTQKIGDDWIRNQTSAVMKAPSAVIPQHDSYLINPRHPDFSKIKIRQPRPFKFDPRFNKS